MISVIIPVYNQVDQLKLCLESLARQTEKDFEIIVVNDGSFKSPEPVIMDFIHSSGLAVKYITQLNGGAPKARNRGYKEAKGEYLLFSDADIVWQSTALAKMLAALKNNPDKAYAYASLRWGKKFFRVGPFSVERLRSGPFIHTSALIRASYFPKFDETVKKFQDWDLWLTILERGGEGLWIDEELLQVIDTGGTMSSWLPAFAYKLMPWLKQVKKYKAAERIIRHKHKLL